VDDAAETLGISVWFAFMNPSTMAGYSPRTWPGRILFFVWSVTCVAFLAGYTANLATILVLENQAEQQWTDIDDVLKDQARVCASRSGSSGRWLLNHHPSYSHIVNAGGGIDTIRKMVKGKCDVAIVWQLNYDIAKMKEEYNGNCLLQKIGPKLDTKFGGWSTFISDERCTALVHDVLHMFLQEMKEKGTIDDHLDNLKESERTLKTDCGGPATQDVSLSLESVSGLFILNVLGAAMACLLYLCSKHSDGIVQRVRSGMISQ
jgi:hypothetical protein